MPRQQKQGGLFSILGTGVGMAAEYHHHRKEQKQQQISLENSQQSEPAGPSTTRSLGSRASSASDQPPAYANLPDTRSDRSLASGKPADYDKKEATARYDKDRISDSDESIEEDEEDWQLDEALERSDKTGLPSYIESETECEPVDDLVREVMIHNSTKAKSPN